MELGHGRIENRSIKVIALEKGEFSFPGARSIAIINRTIENKKDGKTSSEDVAYISSLVEPRPDFLLQVARSHWTIENSLHFVRDDTLREDRQTMHTGNGPFNMAAIRCFAISVANLLGFSSFPDAANRFSIYASKLLKHFSIPHAFVPL